MTSDWDARIGISTRQFKKEKEVCERMILVTIDWDKEMI